MLASLIGRTVLVLNQDPEISKKICNPLKSEGYIVHTTGCMDEAMSYLSTQTPQMIIINPSFDKTTDKKSVDNFFNHVAVKQGKSSVVVLSTVNDSEKMTQYLDLGANDFISMPFVDVEFLARIRTQFRLQDMKDLLHEVNEKLQALVEIDDLTGLFNMRSIYQKLDYEIERSKRFSRSVTVVMLDIDNFKQVNDAHDHLFGSYVISEIGKIIKQCTRAVDIPARYGGDEFLIILSEIPKSGVELFCERLRSTVEKTVFSSGPDSIKLSLSIGYSLFESKEDMASKDLIRQADVALYQAKRTGRNCVVGYTPEIDRLNSDEFKVLNPDFTKKRKTA